MSVDSREDLYGLPLDRFIPERAALAKALRAEKRRDAAAEVVASKKPSVAAWAVNQLVRTRPDELAQLFAAGDALAGAQEQAAAGHGGGDAMREATRRQREALDVLSEAAHGLTDAQGKALSPATLERVGETLRAAALDGQARQQVAAGTLTHELQFIGLGMGDGLGDPPDNEEASPTADPPLSPGPSPQAGAARKAKADAKDNAEAKAKAEAEAKATREASRRHAAELKTAQRAEDRARKAADHAERELTAAQVRHDAATESLREAEALLASAQGSADGAAEELAAAEEAVRALDRP